MATRCVLKARLWLDGSARNPAEAGTGKTTAPFCTVLSMVTPQFCEVLPRLRCGAVWCVLSVNLIFAPSAEGKALCRALVRSVWPWPEASVVATSSCRAGWPGVLRPGRALSELLRRVADRLAVQFYAARSFKLASLGTVMLGQGTAVYHFLMACSRLCGERFAPNH